MALDFTKIGKSGASKTVLHPRELFTVLPKEGSRYQYPRDVQAEVWDRWDARRGERDVVIKMNTGGGKTVVGLVILKSLLNEGIKPAVYITPDPYLTRQVVAEAEALGIAVANNAEDPRFMRGEAVLIANIYKLVNGKSVFGVGTEGSKIPLGAIVVDDAHACLSTTEGQFTLRADSTSKAYKGLLSLFREDLRGQSPTLLLDVEAEDPAKELLVPYWAWIDKNDQVAAILHGERKSSQLEFSWPLLEDVLPLCECVFGGGVVEISPRCMPIEAIPSFANAERRVFMTATLADDSVLVTHFDVDPKAAQAPITPSRADDVGDRLILIPQELNPEIDDGALRSFAAKLAEQYNVVVIVPSRARAELWSAHAAQVLDAKGLGEGIAKLKAGLVGLTVILNKYDGIDLPDDACRVLVLDGLPDVRTKLDRIDQAALAGSADQTAFMIQRIEQGMGRGVRSNIDRCVILLTGRSLTRQLYATGALDMLTPATRAQFDLSQKVAAELRGKSLKNLRGVISQVLKRDRGWVDASRGALVQVKYSSIGNVSATALAQRSAFNAARRRDFKDATARMQKTVNETSDVRVKGWLRAQLARYVHFLDPVESQLILKSAAAENRFVTRPLAGIEYLRLRSVDKDQGASVVEFLVREYPSGNHLLVGLYGLLDQLIFKPETAPAFELGISQLARHIGFSSQRPESEYGSGPDVLWSLGALRYLVVECKNGVVGDTINKGDVNQLTGSMNWFDRHYDASCKPVAVMIHPTNVVERASSPHSSMRVITANSLTDLKRDVVSFAKALANQWPPTHEVAGSLLTHYSLTASLFIEKYSEKPRYSR